MLEKFRTYQLAIRLYKEAKDLRLKGTLKNQFERALLSIALNLSEGSAKPTVKDRKRFYFIAFGSLREVQTILDIVGNENLIKKADFLASHLYRLCHHN